MGILQDRLSTELVDDAMLSPDDRGQNLNESWEAGPIALEDTSEGLHYQDWHLTFNVGDFIVTPQSVGIPTTILTGKDSIQCSFAFDQNARASIFWIDSGSNGNFYWYDSSVAQYVITIYPNIISGLLSLDDKRKMQVSYSDILLFYTREVLGIFNLYHRKQRDRYLIEYLMEEDCNPYMYQLGMHHGLRLKIVTVY